MEAYLMKLEKVRNHSFREDLYVNKIITPSDEVEQEDKRLINQILLKEVLRRRM